MFLVGEEVNEYPREVCDDELLIELIKGHRVIWATQNRGYKDPDLSPHYIFHI